MTRANRFRVPRPALALLAVPALLLGGCATASEPQSLDLTWVAQLDEEQSTVTIDFGGVTCNDLVDGTVVESVEKQGFPEEPTFKATVIGGVTSVSLHFDTLYVFHSSEPFTVVDNSVTFRDQPGTVSRDSGSEGVIDTEATISGTVNC